MPIYEYKCPNCQNIYESIVTLSVSNDVKECTEHPRCPKCDYPGKRQMSVSSFKINGYSEKNGYS